jgi:hypothetical protein
MGALSVYPCLTYRDVPRAIDWLEAAFGIQGEALAPADSRDGQSTTRPAGAIARTNAAPRRASGLPALASWLISAALRPADASLVVGGVA